MRRRVVITGLGALSPNGVGVSAYWDALFSGTSGIRRLTRIRPEQHRHDCGGEVVDFDPLQYFSPRQVQRSGRAAQLNLVAAQMAWDDSGLTIDQLNTDRLGVVVGASGPMMDVLEDKLAEVGPKPGYVKESPFVLQRIFPHTLTVEAHDRVHARAGYGMTVSTACCSGSNAMGLAADRIRAGGLDVALSGAADTAFSRWTFNAFEVTRMMYREPREPEAIMRPFNVDRDGGVLSEGAAYVVLEAYEHAVARGARMYAEWLGFGSTAPEGTGFKRGSVRQGLSRVMRTALADAGLPPSAIDHVSAHAPSAVDSDVEEAEAIWEVFGEDAPRMPVSAIKSMIGNPIGAVGPLQAVALCGTFTRGLVPPTINITDVDPAVRLDVVANTARRNRIRTGLINTHGIDGSNACMLLGTPPNGSLS